MTAAPRTGFVLPALRRVERALTAVNQVIVFAAMIVVVAFTFGQAVDRHLLKTAFSAHDQIAKIGLIWLVFAGTAAAYARGENLRIDLFRRYLSPAQRRARQALFEAAILAVCVLVHVKAWDVLGAASFQQIMGTPFTNVVPYSAILMGTTAIALSSLIRIAAAFRGEAPEP